MKLAGLIFLIFCAHTSMAQVVNGYAEVTGITGGTITIGTVDESGDTFEVGDRAILMQMQDDVIGVTTNVATFGDVGSILSAGLYEVVEIATVVETAGSPSTITLGSAPGSSYNTGANSSLQLITFPTFGSPDYTTTSNMTALDWDGTLGGVIAFEVTGQLTLAHDISADGAGFRGGARSSNNGCCVCVAANTTRYREDNTDLGFKGEGIYKNTTTVYNNGRGHMINGGGGGSFHNGGGSGGGNFVSGGQGGNGWNNCTTNPGGGLGGMSLAPYIAGNRVFMGGGGGGGQQNNSQGRAGGDGGGIVLIRANEITTGACTGLNISSNGSGPLTSGTNDGSGGGGAGGTIIIDVVTWTIPNTCALTVEASGSNGSSSLSGGSHAGGGGGSQGVILYNITQPTTNTTSITNNGTAGCGNTSSPCNSVAGSASGTNNDGIFDGITSPLPVELINFFAVYENASTSNMLYWSTLSEINNAYFEVQKSIDGEDWLIIGEVDGAGNSTTKRDYTFADANPYIGFNYYRLKQYDFDGSFEFSEIVVVDLEAINGVQLYPSFTSDFTNVVSENEIDEILVFDTNGKKVNVNINNIDVSTERIDMQNLPSGLYYINVKTIIGQAKSFKVFKH